MLSSWYTQSADTPALKNSPQNAEEQDASAIPGHCREKGLVRPTDFTEGNGYATVVEATRTWRPHITMPSVPWSRTSALVVLPAAAILLLSLCLPAPTEAFNTPSMMFGGLRQARAAGISAHASTRAVPLLRTASSLAPSAVSIPCSAPSTSPAEKISDL